MQFYVGDTLFKKYLLDRNSLKISLKSGFLISLLQFLQLVNAIFSQAIAL